MWVHHGATLYCLLEGLSPTVARCCLLILILHIVRWSCVLSCSVSHSTAPMISVGSVVKVVSSSSSHHHRCNHTVQVFCTVCADTKGESNLNALCFAGRGTDGGPESGESEKEPTPELVVSSGAALYLGPRCRHGDTIN
jgi:hypothetical protein